MSTELRQQYLDLLKLTLTGLAEAEPTTHRVRKDGSVRLVPADLDERREGRDWPQSGLTMVGMKRLENVQACIEAVLTENVPGDLIETGVWRGGTSIFMRARAEGARCDRPQRVRRGLLRGPAVARRGAVPG